MTKSDADRLSTSVKELQHLRDTGDMEQFADNYSERYLETDRVPDLSSHIRTLEYARADLKEIRQNIENGNKQHSRLGGVIDDLLSIYNGPVHGVVESVLDTIIDDLHHIEWGTYSEDVERVYEIEHQLAQIQTLLQSIDEACHILEQRGEVIINNDDE